MKKFLRTSLRGLFAAGFASAAFAQQKPLESSILDETVITGKRADRTGETNAASQNTASGDEIRARPLLRRGEVLEAIPGMVVTQHAGGGKANQYFLRGFNLDHGTDFATSLDGMPLNMRTHAPGLSREMAQHGSDSAACRVAGTQCPASARQPCHTM